MKILFVCSPGTSIFLIISRLPMLNPAILPEVNIAKRNIFVLSISYLTRSPTYSSAIISLTFSTVLLLVSPNKPLVTVSIITNLEWNYEKQITFYQFSNGTELTCDRGRSRELSLIRISMNFFSLIDHMAISPVFEQLRNSSQVSVKSPTSICLPHFFN